jgi:hypothetical protein
MWTAGLRPHTSPQNRGRLPATVSFPCVAGSDTVAVSTLGGSHETLSHRESLGEIVSPYSRTSSGATGSFRSPVASSEGESHLQNLRTREVHRKVHVAGRRFLQRVGVEEVDV